MKKILPIFLIISLFTKCKDLNDLSYENSYFWAPVLNSNKSDGKITLNLTDPRPFTDYYPFPPSNPDYFEILMSEDMVNFRSVKNVGITTERVVIENLTNDRPYYFFVRSIKSDFTPVSSDTIMTIPSKKYVTEDFLVYPDYSLYNLSVSYDKSYLSFLRYDYSLTGQTGKNLYFKSNSSDEIIPVETTSDASWSPTENKFIYITEVQVGYWIYPNELKLFNVSTQTSENLFDIQYNNYFVISPEFEPDGKAISFLSSENNSDKYIFDLWSLDLVTKQRTEIANFIDRDFFANGKYTWKSTGNEFYLDGLYKNQSVMNIYKFNIPNNILEPVIVTKWTDKYPSLSPDNSKIAFISDRSGYNELWIYDLNSPKYMQLTGELHIFNAQETNIEWMNNEQILVTEINDSKSKIVRISL